MNKNELKVLATCLFLSLPPAVAAAPNEIKIFTDELAAYGAHTLEAHVNKASRAGSGANNRATPFQLMPEYSYGIWRNWELSLQLPLAAQQDRFRTNGYRGELQYVAPHDDSEGSYWGFNFELTRLERNGEPKAWIAEVIPIFAMRAERWHLAANPGITLPLTGGSRKISFEPSAKVAYQAFGKNYFGMEYYLEAGPIRHWLPANQRSQVVYFAWDGKIGKSDINLGIGRGSTDASDRWVVKMIYEVAF